MKLLIYLEMFCKIYSHMHLIVTCSSWTIRSIWATLFTDSRVMIHFSEWLVHFSNLFNLIVQAAMSPTAGLICSHPAQRSRHRGASTTNCLSYARREIDHEHREEKNMFRSDNWSDGAARMNEMDYWMWWWTQLCRTITYTVSVQQTRTGEQIVWGVCSSWTTLFSSPSQQSSNVFRQGSCTI
jgi:hypothetical protein